MKSEEIEIIDSSDEDSEEEDDEEEEEIPDYRKPLRPRLIKKPKKKWRKINPKYINLEFATICLPFNVGKIQNYIGETSQVEMFQKIRNYVTNFNRLTYVANLVANCYFHSLFLHELNNLPESFDLKQMYMAICRVLQVGKLQRTTSIRIQSNFPRLFELIVNQFPTHANQMHSIPLNAMEEAANQYVQNVEHFEYNAHESFLVRYLLVKYPELQVFKYPRSAARWIAHNIMKEIEARDDYDPTWPQYILDQWQLVTDIVAAEVDIFESQFAECPSSIKLIFWRHHMKKNVLERMAVENYDGYRVKMFNIVPIHGISTRHAPIQKTILYNLFHGQVAPKHFKKNKLLDFFTFDYKKIIPNPMKRGEKVQVLSGSTDGGSVHFHFSKRKPPKEDPHVVRTDDDGTEWILDPNLKSLEDARTSNIPTSRLHAMDPGRTNLLTVATPTIDDFDGRFKVGTTRQLKTGVLSRNSFYHETLVKELGKLDSNLLKKAMKHQQQIKDLHQTFCANSLKSVIQFDQVIARTRIYFDVFDRFFSIYNQRKSLKRKFFLKQRRKKVLDKLVEKYFGFGATEDVPHVVGYGDWSESMGPRKGEKPRGSFNQILTHAKKRLRHRVFFVKIAEYHTSKLISCCFTEAKNLKNSKRQRVHGILHCTQCGKTISRDVSASENMLKILMIELNKPLHESIPDLRANQTFRFYEN